MSASSPSSSSSYSSSSSSSSSIRRRAGKRGVVLTSGSTTTTTRRRAQWNRVIEGSSVKKTDAFLDNHNMEDEERNNRREDLFSKLSVVSLTSFSYFQSACNEAYADVYANPDWQMGVPTEEATPLQNLFGFLFTAFCGWYFWRVVKKRGKRAQTFRVANQLSPEELKEREEERKLKDKKLSASQAFTGGITGIAISTVLYIFASKVSDGFDNSSLPESYTARQISITVRTIVEGLVYLATFVYAANGVGLTMLGFKKLKNRYFDISLEDALEESRKEEGGNDSDNAE